MIRFLLVSLLSVLIDVHSQADFDALPARLDSVLALKQSARIDVRIHPGVYFYRERSLFLTGLDCPETQIAFSGDDCVLVAEDDGKGHRLENNYVDLERMEPVDVWGTVCKARTWPVPVLFHPGVYKILSHEPDVSEEDARDLWLHITQWFSAPFYRVLKIENGWIYFRKETESETWMWSELRYGRCLPRFILCDKPSRDDLHACTAANFLTVTDSRLGSVTMENIRFLGNGAGNSLIWFEDVQSDSIRVSDCTFTHIRSSVIHIANTNDFSVTNCSFTENYQNCISIHDGSRNSVVSNSRFVGNGRMMTNAPLIRCRGVNYWIHDNYFEDFSYSALGLGIHFTEEDLYGSGGVVEHNEICQSPAFREGIIRCLVDSGAIYIATNNQRTVVRENYVHDIDGPHYNRGIFADDGPKNVTIEGNTVLRIHNGYCIDLRKCLRVRWLRNSKVSTPNTGNIMRGNRYDGRARFYVRPGDPTSYVGENQKVCE